MINRILSFKVLFMILNMELILTNQKS